METTVQNPTLGVLADVLQLAAVERSRWDEVRAGIPDWHPRCDESSQTARPDPYGAFLDDDGRVIVDDFTNPISNITEIVREFTRDNEGYWIEDVFNSPGWTIRGGAVRYTITSPGDHFLPDGQTLAPRAPGAEAPRIGGTRRRPILAYPESLSGTVEVSDEARTDNNVIEVQTTFRQAANSFADIMQGIGETALEALVLASSRQVFGGTGTFTDWDAADPIYNNTSTDPRPSAEFARVRRLFVQDKGGVVPDTLVWAPEDAENFDRVYEDRGDAVLARYGIRNVFTSVRRDPGKRLYLRSGQVGTLAWATPMGDPEYNRAATRKTDEYVLDGRFVFVANGADAIYEVVDAVS